MSKKNYRIWLRGCKLRTFKKVFGSHIDVDGIGYSLIDYTKIIKYYKTISVGDIIYNPYRNIFENVKEVKRRWRQTKYKNIRYLNIVFITKEDYIVYDLCDYVIEKECGRKDLPAIPENAKILYLK